MTHPSDMTLLRFADGEHSKETTEHLAECATCRETVQDSRRVRTILRAIPVPSAPDMGRLGGITHARPTRWHAIAATLVAGILIGGTATYVGESDVTLAGFIPGVARPTLPTEPHPIGPGRWSYLRRSFQDSVLWASPHLETVTVDSSGTDWLIVTTTPEGERDSLRVDRNDLTPRSGSWDSPGDWVHASEQFTRDSTIVFIASRTRSRRFAYPVGDSALQRIANAVELRLFFRTAGLDRHWRRNVRMLTWGLDSAHTAALAVSGRHTIATPIGPCDCWQVAMSMGGRRGLLWVRAEDGVVVKTENEWGVTELVAEDPLPN